MNRRRYLLHVLCAGACASSASVVTGAAAAPNLRVRGTAVIEAAATALDGHVEVKGALRDDTGRPIGNAQLQMRLFDKEGGSALALPSAEACPPSPSLHEARAFPGEPDQYVVDADDSGGFCVRIPADVEGTFELVFAESGGLYDSARKVLPLDRARLGVELVFAAPPTSLPLEAAQNTLTLELRMRPVPEVRPEVPVQVLIAERGFNVTVVARAGEATPLALSRDALARPGPVDIVARYGGTERYQPAETRLRTSVTARVELSLVAQPSPAKADRGIPIQVAVGSIVGAVSSGSVEARVAGETVGIAQVKNGVANITARFEVRRKTLVPITLVYLPAEPWWLPSNAVDVSVEALPPSSWGRAGWVLALLVVAAWLIAGWWRPRRVARSSERASDKPRPAVPALQVLETFATDSGWRGVVLDAHDRKPIAGATIALVRRSFEGALELQRAAVGADGAFEFAPLADRGGVWVVTQAAWHSTLERPLPPAGRLSIELITRRRQLVGRLVAWAERHGRPWADVGEPTPGHIAGVAGLEQKHDIKDWARAVEVAAFGPTPVDDVLESQITAKEPPGSDHRSQRNERDH